MRQLRNVIEHALIMAHGPLISTNDIPYALTRKRQEGKTRSFFQMRVGVSLEEARCELISRTLKFTEGNKSRAASLLGITPKTLYNIMEGYSKHFDRSAALD